MTDYINFFTKYLLSKGYPAETIFKNKYRYDGRDFGRIEVSDGDGSIIQAFVFMSKENFPPSGKFPFYRTYSQRNIYGYLMPPACNVVTLDEKENKWHIHNAANLRAEITRASFLNYEEARKRFERRLDYFGNAELAKTIRCRAGASIVVLLLYMVAHILSVNGLLGHFSLPFDVTIMTAFIVVMALLLLPPLIPYIRSVAIGNVGLNLTEPGPKKK